MKKVLGVILAITMILGLAACGDTANTNSSKVENNDTVVAVFKGKNITRGDIGDELLESEKEIILNYVYSEVAKEFFKDVEVTDSELELQLQLMKTQVGEEQWPLYLSLYGGGDEETFKGMLRDSLRQEKYISQKSESIEISDDRLLELYNENPDKYNIVVLDVVFMGDTEAFAKSKTLYSEGKSLEEIAEALGTEVSQDEHAYFNTEGLTWESDFNDCSVGDVVFSGEDSGSLVIARIKELNKGVDNPTVKTDMVNSLKHEEAYNATNDEYVEFLKTQTVNIFGQDYPLYEEEDTTDATDATDATDSNVIETTN